MCTYYIFVLYIVQLTYNKYKKIKVTFHHRDIEAIVTYTVVRAMDFRCSNIVEADITSSGATGSISDTVPSVQSCSYTATLGNGVNLSSNINSSALGVPMMADPFSGSSGSDRKRTRRVAAADDETFEDILGQSKSLYSVIYSSIS